MRRTLAGILTLMAMTVGSAGAQATGGVVEKEVVDRPGFREVFLSSINDGVRPHFYTMEADTELLVHTLYTGTLSGSNFLILELQQATPGEYIPAWTNGYDSSTVVKFDPPLPMQIGDRIQFSSLDTEGVMNILLHGSPVPAPTPSGLSAR